MARKARREADHFKAALGSKDAQIDRLQLHEEQMKERLRATKQEYDSLLAAQAEEVRSAVNLHHCR